MSASNVSNEEIDEVISTLGEKMRTLQTQIDEYRSMARDLSAIKMQGRVVDGATVYDVKPKSRDDKDKVLPEVVRKSQLNKIKAKLEN